MNKLEIQKRVLQNGEPLHLDKFEWNEKAKTFSTDEDNLVLDFNNINNIIFTTGTGCIFTTGSGCTFKTDSHCIFTTGPGCTFTTDSHCTFTTGSGCIFKTHSGCVIVRRDVFEVIQPKKDDIIQLCPYQISGHLINGLKDGVPHIIADGILSKVISKKGNIYKVINHGDTKQSYLVKSGDKYSHGETLKQARDNLVYKLADRDTSKYKDLTLESVLTKDESIACYMSITGACELGTKYFVDKQDMKKQYSVKKIIQLTKGQFGNDAFAKFFNYQP